MGTRELKGEVTMATVGTKGMAWGPGEVPEWGFRLELPVSRRAKGDMDSPVWARPWLLKSAQRVCPQHGMLVASAPRTMGVNLHMLWEQPEYWAAENRNVLRTKGLKSQACLLSKLQTYKVDSP